MLHKNTTESPSLSSSRISVGVRFERDGVHDALVKYKSIVLCPGHDSQPLGGSVPRKKMRVGDGDTATRLLRILQFIQHILTQPVVVELSMTTNTPQRESPHLAFHLARSRLVPIFFGPPEVKSIMWSSWSISFVRSPKKSPMGSSDCPGSLL